MKTNTHTKKNEYLKISETDISVSLLTYIMSYCKDMNKLEGSNLTIKTLTYSDMLNILSSLWDLMILSSSTEDIVGEEMFFELHCELEEWFFELHCELE